MRNITTGCGAVSEFFSKYLIPNGLTLYFITDVTNAVDVSILNTFFAEFYLVY